MIQCKGCTTFPARAGMNRILGRHDLAAPRTLTWKDCHHDPLQRMPHHV